MLLTLVLGLFTVVESLRALNVPEPAFSAIYYLGLGVVVGGGIFCVARSMWYNALTYTVTVTQVVVVVGADPFTRVNDDVITAARNENRIRNPERTLGGRGPVRELGYRILVTLGDTSRERVNILRFLCAIVVLFCALASLYSALGTSRWIGSVLSIGLLYWLGAFYWLLLRK